MKLFRVKKSKILGARTYIFEGSLAGYNFIYFFSGKKNRSKGQENSVSVTSRSH